MIRIIINADDLGKNPEVNRYIEEALQNDYISSSTIMANSAYLQEVKRITESFGDTKSFGVHLNITEGSSLTNNPVLRDAGMIDENGCFIRSHNFESRLYEKKLIDAVAQEWDAQVYEILAKGIKISHLDGHHHCHTWYGFYEALLRVTEKYHITKIRNTFISPFVTTKDNIIKSVSKLLLQCNLINASKNINITRKLASIRYYQDKIKFLEATRGLVKTDFFDAYENFCSKAKGLPMNAILPNSAIVELMCHPGHPTYQNEYQMITSDKLGIIHDPDIALINYNDL